MIERRIEQLAGGCLVSRLDAGEAAADAGITVRHPLGPPSGNSGLSLRSIAIAPGIAALPPSPAADEVFYVVEGSGSVLLEGARHPLEAGCGLYLAAGRAARFENPGPGPLRLAAAFVPASAPQPPAAHPIVRLADREAIPTADRWYRVLVDAACGSREVTQFVGGIPPGRAPEHYHHYEEILVILEGEGRMWAGATSAPVTAGSCVWLPAKQKHCMENLGPRELWLLGVFWPAGSPAVRYSDDAPAEG